MHIIYAKDEDIDDVQIENEHKLTVTKIDYENEIIVGEEQH